MLPLRTVERCWVHRSCNPGSASETYVSDLSQLEKAIGHTFARRELLLQALTHSSHSHEHSESGVYHNEQLEFLGDAILGFLVSGELVERFPDCSEGQLSKMKAHLVSASHLLAVASQLRLGAFLQLGRGEEKSGGRHKRALLVDALEALIAALYLDAGLEKTRMLVAAGCSATGWRAELINSHDRLQVDAAGIPASCSPAAAALRCGGRAWPGAPQNLYRRGPGRQGIVSQAKGATKKAAEQEAARAALLHFQQHTAQLASSPAAAGLTWR